MAGPVGLPPWVAGPLLGAHGQPQCSVVLQGPLRLPPWLAGPLLGAQRWAQGPPGLAPGSAEQQGPLGPPLACVALGLQQTQTSGELAPTRAALIAQGSPH